MSKVIKSISFVLVALAAIVIVAFWFLVSNLDGIDGSGEIWVNLIPGDLDRLPIQEPLAEIAGIRCRFAPGDELRRQDKSQEARQHRAPQRDRLPQQQPGDVQPHLLSEFNSQRGAEAKSNRLLGSTPARGTVSASQVRTTANS